MIDFIVQSKEYLYHLIIFIGIYTILAQGLNLNFGLGGMFNLAHVASYAIGAYTTAILATEYGLAFFPCILFSAIFAGFFAILLGAISLRLSVDYFAIGTLAFSSVISALLINWKSLTRGVLGIPGIPRPEIFNFEFNENIHFLFLLYAFVIIIQLLLYVLFKSPYSRTLKSQAEFIHASQSLAKNTTRARTFSFMIASASAGIAGSFFAYYINYIDPSSFSLQEMIFVFTIIIVGRPGSFWGCLAAATFLVLLPEPIRFIKIPIGEGINPWEPIPASILGPARQLIYATILFTMVYINRGTLFPVQRKV